jgi:cytochrome c oxidase assembly factor CtaG
VFDPLPEGVFQYKFPFDPTLFFFVGLGILYAVSLARTKRWPVEWWQVASFYVGLLVLVGVLLPPIDPWSDRLFFVHMIQHMAITHVGAPLLSFGIPFLVVLRVAPVSLKKRVYIPMLRSSWVQSVWWFVTHPLVALALFEINYWVWHYPYFYNLALLNDFWHLLEHACMAATSILLWRNIITPKPIKARISLPTRLLYIAIIMAANIVLSFILTFSEEVLYAYQGVPQPEWWTWGYLQDQQLGGLIMWVPGGILEFIAMTICFFTWVHFENLKDSRVHNRQ